MKTSLKSIISISMLAILLLTIITPLQALSINIKAEYEGSTIEKPLIHEATKIIAGREEAAIISHAYLGGNVTFNAIDISSDAFNNLLKLIVIVENGEWSREYWPYPLWPWPEGLTIVIQYQGITIDEALSRGEMVVGMVKQELNVEADIPLFHFQARGDIYTLVYITTEEVDFESTVDKWASLLPVNIEDTLINVDNIKVSNLTSVVFAILEDTKEGGFITWMATIYINPNAITIKDGEYTLSVNTAVGHEGSIYPVPDVRYSEIFVRIPYVGNVTYFNPLPDNLFPDMTGRFRYLLKPEDWPVNNTGANDIVIKYNFNYTPEWKFPVIRTTFYTDPWNPEINVVNGSEIEFWVNITNVGEKTAKDITIRMPVDFELTQGMPILDNKIFTSVDEWFNQYYPEITYPNGTKEEFTWNFTEWVKNFWINATATLSNEIWINGTPASLNMTENVKEEILETYEEGERKLIKTWNIHIDELEPNETIRAGYVIKIDSLEEALNRSDMDIELNVPDGSYLVPKDANLHILYLYQDNYKELLKEVLINYTKKAVSHFQEAIDTLADKDPSALHFGLPFGPMVVFHDKIGHEYFVMANGYETQFNDEEPVIIPVVTLDSYSLLIGQTTNVTCTIYNYGNADATNVSVEFIHAIVGYNWTLLDKRVFYQEDIGTIKAGSNITTQWVDVPRTFVGMHPGLVKVYFKDEDGLQHEVYSNVIFALLFPKKVPEPDYPYPHPEVNVNKDIEIKGVNETSVGDIITVTINITNTGTEDTGIKIYEAFNSSALRIEKMDKYHYIKIYRTLPNGTQIDITDEITYRVHFNAKVDNFNVTVITLLAKRGVGIRLGVNETITVVYKVRLLKPGLILIYPTRVEFTTKFPIEHKMEIGEEESKSGAPSVKLAVKQEGVEAENVWAVYSGSLATYVKARVFLRIAKLAVIGILTIVAVATIVVWRNRKKPLEEVEPLLLKAQKPRSA
nr:hypothetical protein [Candidatus Baldrarchaeota archaeon]